jgi:hypothetical protein
MSVPKHDRLIERMTDAFWSMNNAQRSVTDPERMREVIACICAEMRKAPRALDSEGCLGWAAAHLEARLEDEDGPGPPYPEGSRP